MFFAGVSSLPHPPACLSVCMKGVALDEPEGWGSSDAITGAEDSSCRCFSPRRPAEVRGELAGWPILACRTCTHTHIHTHTHLTFTLLPSPPHTQSANYDGTSGLFSKEEMKSDEKKKSKEQLYTRINKLPTAVKVPEGPRKMFVFRHSERVDVTFGKQWIDNSFDPQGMVM